MAGLGRMALVALGILAYNNRDKLADMVSGVGRDPNDPNARGGLADLLDKLRNAGHGDAVDSWVGTGPNTPLERSRVEQAIDDETLTSLTRQTGLSREEILDRLATNLPEAVNDMTPDGKLPGASGDAESTLLDPVPPTRV
jgi:uncharacterized protein YidB (DUF937 family)